ncbi:MAG: serine/threonine-protein kinase [Phycisphaerales bacterium]
MEGPESISQHDLEQIALGLIDDPTLLERVRSSPELSARLEQIKADNALLSELAGVSGSNTELDAIAGYELLGEIHRGGQGVVYKARQKATDRLVAVKTLIQGAFATETQRLRFDREVRLAARLKHPSIVTVYESGRTPMGTSYIVLELVEGVPVDRYVADLRTKGDLRSIARLFLQISDAIRYAHQRGVIHRDLKPGNVLVDARGVPHVLDFGIAKAFDEETRGSFDTTRQGEFVGTLAYAAPEQLANDPDVIDVRVDIYALGVMLYEAVTGQRPIQGKGALADVIHRITTQPPTPPRQLNPRVDRDLETIIMTALAKSPRQRYQTAADLHDDLEFWLAGWAIRARGQDFWYSTRKALLRHRLAATFLLLIVGSAITTTVLTVKYMRENATLRQIVTAEREAIESIDRETSMESVASLSGYLVTLLHRIESNVKDRPEIEATLRDAVGSAYIFQDQFEAAERELLAAQRLRRQMFKPPHPALALSLHNLGRLRFKQGRFPEAEAYYREALAMRRQLFGPEHDDVARTLHHLALTVQELGRMDEAEQCWREALAIRRRILPPGDARIANTLSGLATLEMATGEYEKARRSLAEVLDMVEKDQSLGPKSLPAGRVLHNLGTVLTSLGEYEQGRAVLERALEIKESAERNMEYIAKTLAELGRNRLWAQADLPLARRWIERSLALRRSRNSSGDQVAESLRLLAEVCVAEGDPESAVRLIGEADEQMARSSRPADHWDFGLVHATKARVFAAAGRDAEALSAAERADTILSRQRSDADPDVRRNLETLAMLYQRLGRTEPLRQVRERLSRAAFAANPEKGD